MRSCYMEVEEQSQAKHYFVAKYIDTLKRFSGSRVKKFAVHKRITIPTTIVVYDGAHNPIPRK